MDANIVIGTFLEVEIFRTTKLETTSPATYPWLAGSLIAPAPKKNLSPKNPKDYSNQNLLLKKNNHQAVNRKSERNVLFGPNNLLILLERTVLE